ncbi:MAG: chemotaxis protein [Xanthobacteraceae bacterium]
MSKTKARSNRPGVRASERRGAAAAFSSVASLAEVTADSLEAVLAKIDGEVFRELNLIADHIETLRKEIVALQPSRMHRESIPAAGLELDAIVSATESASNIILGCAEQVMAANASDPKRYKAFVDEQMLAVFEACSFQDLTGQRIGKVVDTLKQIEARVARFAKAARAEDAGKLQRAARLSTNTQEAIDRIIDGRKRG